MLGWYVTLNKKELMQEIYKIKKESIHNPDHEKSHRDIDTLLYEYIGFTDEEQEIIDSLCPWYA